MHKTQERNFTDRNYSNQNRPGSTTAQAGYNLYSDLANIKGALQEATHNVKDRAGEIWSNSIDSVRNTSTDLRDNVSSFISHKPMKAIGIAAIAGIALGLLLRK